MARGQKPSPTYTHQGFTIVELLIVIVVIGILAAITLVAYNGITASAGTVALKSDLRSASTQLALDRMNSGSYPESDAQLPRSESTTFQYDSDGSTFCLIGASSRSGVAVHYVTQEGAIVEGECPIRDGSAMQRVSNANCPASRTRAMDARDRHTYWVQKLSDGKCWMLTNLAYAGGGANTYGDVVSPSILTEGVSGNSYTEAKFYIPSGANVTSGTANPSASTNGTGQYGYLYNWCAAMGGQAQACKNPAGSSFTSATICPSGWRLPTGGGDGELAALNAVVNGDSTSSDAGLLSGWLAQRSGYWGTSGGILVQGQQAAYWSSSYEYVKNPAPSEIGAYRLFHRAASVQLTIANLTSHGFSVRCIAM